MPRHALHVARSTSVTGRSARTLLRISSPLLPLLLLLHLLLKRGLEEEVDRGVVCAVGATPRGEEPWQPRNRP